MRNSFSLAILVTLVLFGATLAADAEAWRSRSIYQVLTDRFARTDGNTAPCNNLRGYCGGTFTGLKNKLDYIASMGFDAVWISPVVSNSEGGYHGYWTKNFYTINSYFGTPQELKDLIKTAHSKGIWVMVDVVANHVAPVVLDFSKITPFNSPSHYHARCQINNWYDQHEVEYCRLADLPDLDQSNPYVKNTLIKWVKDLVAEYGFDGIRIDTVPEVEKGFWSDFTKAAGVYSIGEVSNYEYSYIGQYQNHMDALVNYNLYYKIKEIFGGRQSMYNFRTHFQNMDRYFKNQDVLGNFVECHDTPRFLNLNPDRRTFKAALAFTLTTRGIPVIYYGSEHGFNGADDPYNREAFFPTKYAQSDLTEFLRTINKYRKATKWYNQVQVERYVDDSFFAFTRGSTFVAFTNQPDSQQVRVITYHPYSEGQSICNIFYPTDCVKIQGGKFSVYLNNGEVKIFVPSSSIKNVLESI